MRRRQVLALCGAGIAGLAGCLSDPSGDESPPASGPTATPTGDGTATPTPPATELSVTVDALQPAFVGLNVDAYGMVSEPDSQYLFLGVSVLSGPRPSPSDIVFRFDGDEYGPIRPGEGPDVQREVGSGDGGESGWVLFRLPETGDAGDAALVWPGGEWRPDERLRVRLAAPLPPLSVAEWTVPETVSVGNTVAFEFAVRNRGDLPGRFVGAVNAEGWAPHRPVAILSRRIPPGETESWEVAGEEIELFDDELAQEVGDDEPDITYELLWPGGSEDKSVRVVDG